MRRIGIGALTTVLLLGAVAVVWGQFVSPGSRARPGGPIVRDIARLAAKDLTGNRLINGGMWIDQRNAGASQTITAAAALAYTVDRWYAYGTGANVTGQRVAGSGAFEFAYKFTGATSNTAIGFAQRIEATNVYDLASTPVTLSAFTSSSSLTTITWIASFATTTADTFGTIASPTVTQIATGTWPVTPTLTRNTTSFVLPAGAQKGVQIEFKATAGLATTQTWTITGAQLEAGSTPSAFAFPNRAAVLDACQRYYERLDSSVAIRRSMAMGFWNSTTQAYGFVYFRVTKRAMMPTMTTSATAADFVWFNPTTQADIALTSVPSLALNGADVVLIVGTTGVTAPTVGAGTYLTSASAAGAPAFIAFAAEL